MESLARRLVLTAKAMRAHFEHRLAAEGASLTFWLVLRNLAEEDGLSQRQLAARLSVEAPTLTRHLDRMVAEGLVTRKQDTSDRRITRISLTASGRRMHKALASMATEMMGQFDSLMSPSEARVVERVLSRIDRHLEGIEADAAG